jgi:hypothetical protein
VKRIRFARAGLGLFVILTLAACGPATTSVKPGTMPEGGSYHAVWHSPQFGRMELCDSRGTVVGEYQKDTRHGRIHGKVKGDLLRFEWTEEKHVVRGRPNVMNGRGYFKLIQTDEGRFRIEGEWGYGDDEVGGGPWAANQIRGAAPDNCYASVRKQASSSGGSDPFGDDAEDSEHADF